MELLLTLFALVALQLSPENIPAAFKQLKSPGNKKFFEQVSGLEDTIKAFLQGNEDFTPLLAGLKAYIQGYEKRPDARASVVALFKAFLGYMSSGRESAFKNLEKMSSNPVFPVWVGQAFNLEQIDQTPINNQLRQLMLLMTGQDRTAFEGLEEAADAKARLPEVYAEWQSLRKEHAKSWKASMSEFVKASGRKTVPYKDLMKFFKKEGIEHSMPEGFEGRIDAAGKWYSPFDELLTGVPQSTVFPAVRMNPNYEKGSSEYVCVCIRRAGGEGGYIYTLDSKNKKSVQKFQKVEDFSKIVTSVRKRWVQNIMNGDAEDPVTVASVVLELLYEFSARIGSRPNEHNGVSSLMVGNYTETQRGFILKYLGKDSVPTKHVFVADTALNKKIAEIVKILATHPHKNKKSFLFTYNLKSGAPKLVQAGVVTKVFRQCGAGQLSVHKLRTYHATELMKDELNKVYSRRTKFKNTAEAFGLLKKLALKVGKDLNHVRRNALGETSVTASTALANYIDVSLQVAFFQHYALPVPKYLERFVSNPEKLLASPRAPLTADLQAVADQHAAQVSEDEQDQAEHLLKEGLDSEEMEEHQDEDKDEEEAVDEKIKQRLERDAERIGHMLTKGGGGPANFAPTDSGFNNVLV